MENFHDLERTTVFRTEQLVEVSHHQQGERVAVQELPFLTAVVSTQPAYLFRYISLSKTIQFISLSHRLSAQMLRSCWDPQRLMDEACNLLQPVPMGECAGYYWSGLCCVEQSSPIFSTVRRAKVIGEDLDAFRGHDAVGDRHLAAAP